MNALTLFRSVYLLALIAAWGGSCIADEVLLKNGLLLEGTAVEVPGLNSAMANRNVAGNIRFDSFWMVDDGVRRYFVHRLNVEDIKKVDELAQKVSYNLTHRRTTRKRGPSIVGSFSGVEPFDQFGRRTVMLKTSDGLTPIVQAITELRPDYLTLTGLTHQWDYALDTKTLTPDVLEALITQASDRTNPSERKAAVIFYLQAGMSTKAQAELDQIAQEFPELAEWAREYQDRITEVKARTGINEVQRRRSAGQHRLAFTIAKKAPADELSASVFREAQDIVKEYEEALMQREEAILMLDMLQAELKPEDADRLRSMRATLTDELKYETIDRLKPFLRSAFDETLTPSQKLALGYSGWIVGEANATLNLQEAIFLWDARFLVLEFLRNLDNPIRDDELITKISELEYVNLSRIVQMVPYLPPPLQASTVTPATITERNVEGNADDPQVRYSLMLPPEYSPHHEYPLLVVLRSSGRSYENEIRWWAGDTDREGWAQRRGYIVVAPHYTDDSSTSYGGNPVAHQVVVKSIEDVKKRYRIDSDRVFLVGHEMGADACFDIGLSRFDLFAGVVPIAGEGGKICNYYTENAPDLAWYLVNGQRDRNTLETNARILNEMMRHGQNIVYCEYKERGFESYYEEQEKLFEWMQFQRRPAMADLKEWEASTMRRTDHSFHWVEATGLNDRLFPDDIFSSRRAKTIYGKAKLNNNVHVQVPGSGATVWLSPEFVDFDDRVRIYFNTKLKHSDFVEPSIQTMLTRLRKTGDRKRLYWAKVDL